MKQITHALARAFNVAPTNDEAHGTPHAAGPQDQQSKPDFAARAAGDQQDKAFQTLRAKLALRGYALSRTHHDDGPVVFHVNRWGMVRELRDLASVVDFADQAGATHA